MAAVFKDALFNDLSPKQISKLVEWEESGAGLAELAELGLPEAVTLAMNIRGIDRAREAIRNIGKPIAPIGAEAEAAIARAGSRGGAGGRQLPIPDLGGLRQRRQAGGGFGAAEEIKGDDTDVEEDQLGDFSRDLARLVGGPEADEMSGSEENLEEILREGLQDVDLGDPQARDERLSSLSRIISAIRSVGGRGLAAGAAGAAALASIHAQLTGLGIASNAASKIISKYAPTGTVQMPLDPSATPTPPGPTPKPTPIPRMTREQLLIPPAQKGLTGPYRVPRTGRWNLVDFNLHALGAAQATGASYLSTAPSNVGLDMSRMMASLQ